MDQEIDIERARAIALAALICQLIAFRVLGWQKQGKSWNVRYAVRRIGRVAASCHWVGRHRKPKSLKVAVTDFSLQPEGMRQTTETTGKTVKNVQTQTAGARSMRGAAVNVSSSRGAISKRGTPTGGKNGEVQENVSHG